MSTNSTKERLSRTSALTTLAAAVTVGLTALGLAPPAVAQESKPNILFIMGDDIGWMQPSIYHEGLAVGETPKALWLKELQSYIDFPMLQNPASYNLEQVMQQVRKMKSTGLSD